MKTAGRFTAAGLVVLVLSACVSAGPAPTHPPDGRIAFVAQGVWVMNADGTGQTRLTNGAGPGVSWSPDGQKIVFDSNPGISVMNADGSHLTLLASAGESPAWSPDGQRIAFVVRPEANSESIRMKETEIVVMNVDGSGRIRLTNSSGPVSDRAPAWLPGGSRIAFIRDPLGDTTGGGECEWSCVINVDGSGLTSLPDIGEDPAWSPDGQRIASVSSSTSTGSDGMIIVKAGISVMSADGSDLTILTPSLSGEFADPAWSPDGRKIAFAHTPGVTDVFGDTTFGRTEIDVMDANGANLTRLTDGADSISGLSWR